MERPTDVCRPAVLMLADYDPGMTIEEVERELGLKDVVKRPENESACGTSPQALQAMAAEPASVSMYPEQNERFIAVLEEELLRTSSASRSA
jgi:histidinol-phosphate/aromatic aminotransferase/cobyric acid decarboxylase-like protein